MCRSCLRQIAVGLNRILALGRLTLRLATTVADAENESKIEQELNLDNFNSCS